LVASPPPHPPQPAHRRVRKTRRTNHASKRNGTGEVHPLPPIQKNEGVRHEVV
jgi:hypothetical protein